MNHLLEHLDRIMPTALTGSVVETQGTTIAVADFPAPVGAIVEIMPETGKPIEAEVIGFRQQQTLIFPLQAISGIRHGTKVKLKQTSRMIRVGEELLGRVLDAHGNCTDQNPPPLLTRRIGMDQSPPPAIERPRIEQTFSTGIRSIDGMLTCGQGQRIGIFAGSGVGKSVTLGMMARYAEADVNVIGLIGERGREVNDFIERDLGPEGMKKSILIVATSDQPAILRVQAALTATAIAEYFRDQGQSVLFMMDSVTRFAMAQREIGLAAGEPPTSKGYPPSVFAMLPKLVERTGNNKHGSITAFYTVLVEGDDTNEPVSDSVRGLLDGHVILSRDLAAKGHYPAIEILGSISRLMNDLVPADWQQSALVLRELLATYRDNEDLINIGAYRQGTNPKIDLAIRMKPEIDQFLRQAIEDSTSITDTQAQLMQLAQKCAGNFQPNGNQLPNNQPK